VSDDKISRLQNAVSKLAGWAGTDISELIADGLIEEGDLIQQSAPALTIQQWGVRYPTRDTDYRDETDARSLARYFGLPVIMRRLSEWEVQK
jgi:hypothetical protein